MTTKVLITVLVLAGLFTGTMVFAEEEGAPFDSQKFLEEDAAIIEPGVLPNSFWYWGDIFAEEIKFLFTVGKEQKADFLMETAKERLAEMQKLSEDGITKYADRLLVENEDAIANAQKFYKEVREEAPEKLKEYQEDTEREILKKEYKIKGELQNAESNYLAKQETVAEKVGGWLKGLVSHLSWKRDKIQEQRSEMFDD
jgi:hypothetical protein